MENAWPGEGIRRFGRPPRVMGVDVARALAIIGMIGAHLGETDAGFDPSAPRTWSSVVHGHPSVLFAVIAGVSVALMSGREAGPPPGRLPEVRLRMLARGGVVFVIGIALELLDTRIAVILTLYGVLYAALVPVLRWGARRLLVAAGVLTLAGPTIMAFVAALAPTPPSAVIEFVFFGTYPLTVWLAYALAGMGLGRLGIGGARAPVAMIVAGAAAAIVGHALGAVGRDIGIRSLDHGRPAGAAIGSGGWDAVLDHAATLDLGGIALQALLSVDPHSGGTADILAAGGVAIAVTGACVLIARRARLPLLPLAALGSMPLSAYSAHVISYALMAGPGGSLSDNGIWLVSVVVLLALTTAWSITLGRGPLERLTAWVAGLASSAPGRARAGTGGTTLGP